MDSAEFEDAWRGYWAEKLGAVAEGMDAVLTVRSQAMEDGDATAFLSTVDPTVPHLVAEQRSYFSYAMDLSEEKISYEWEPLALLKDGSVLANIFVVRETTVDESTLTGPLCAYRFGIPLGGCALRERWQESCARLVLSWF
jgi:hypothetical protein